MPEWCQKRITSIELKLRFGDGKHRFYLESVCASPVRGPPGTKLCDSCRMLQVQTKTQDVRTFPHGFVTGEYPEESHIFDGPWYHSKVEAYGSPSPTDVAMAMEAQRRARKGVTTKAMKDLIDILVAGAKTEAGDGAGVEEKKEDAVAGPVGGAVGGAVGTKPKAKAKAKAKARESSSPPKVVVPDTQIQPVERMCTSFPKQFQFVESMDDPIEVEIVPVSLKRIVHEDCVYLLDETSGRLYETNTEGKKGEYVGHWDVDAQVIVED